MQWSLLLLAGLAICGHPVLAQTGDYEVIGVASNATSVTITWRVPDDLAEREWGVVYRRSTESAAHMRLVPAPKGDQLTQRRLEVGGLTPGTAYLLCVAYGREDGTVAVEPRKCVGASTAPLVIRSVLTSVGGASDPASLTVAWRLEAPALRRTSKGGGAYRHEWAVRIRKAEGDKFADIPVYDITSRDETDGQSYEFDVSELHPDALYEVCLVDVEHALVEDDGRGKEGAEPSDGRTSCAFARTKGSSALRGAEIAAIVCAVGAGLIALAAIAWRRRSRKKEEGEERIETPPPLPTAMVEAEEEEEDERKRANPYQAAWHTVRLPSQFRPRPEFRSFRTGYSYGDFLTTVTIYGSGYSEC